MKFLSLIVAAFMACGARAGELQIKGDLMIHPQQLAGFFDLAAKNIAARDAWSWPELSFAKPYRTSWSRVEARGPFAVKFDVGSLAAQEAGFELTWATPTVNVGQFEIHDTITRNVGGVNLIVHLDGACSNMQLRIPDGQWRVRGKIKWNWTATGLQVDWKEFNFAMSDMALASIDLGQCVGPAGIQQALREAMLTVSKDPAWMTDVLRDGALDWIQSALAGLQGELLKSREFPLRPGLTAAWQPERLFDAGGGLLRIAGALVLRKPGVEGVKVMERTFDVADLSAATESGFVLPKDTLQGVVGFLYENGELGYRLSSFKVEAFTRLMQNRFIQFFVWPDLMKFARNAEFFFDLRTERAPVLTNGRMSSAGLHYSLQAPVLVQQWAPGSKAYVPYADFRANANGDLVTRVQNHKMTLSLAIPRLDIKTKFRSEYSLLRRINQRISSGLLGSRVADYLNDNPFSLEIPSWQVGEGLSLGIKGAQSWKQSFRVPLEFAH